MTFEPQPADPMLPVQQRTPHDSPQQDASQVPDATSDAKDSVKPLRRACDCCRKRKVKCDGSEPCGPCKKASIRCAYLQPPKKKGPKGLRSARVLHALRRIDDVAVHQSGVGGGISPTSPISPHEPGWQQGWQQQWQGQSAATSGAYGGYQESVPPPTAGMMPTSAPVLTADHANYFSQPPLPRMATTMPAQQPLPQPAPQYQPTSYPDPAQHWQQQSAGASVASSSPQNAHHIMSPASTHTSEPYPQQPQQQQQQHQRISSASFQPYVNLFFQHMFPIMPVIDRNVYLDPSLYSPQTTCLNSDMYCFLCALCATVIVQLDESVQQPPPPNEARLLGKAPDDLFAESCLAERRTYDYVDSASTLSVMTSFFLFCYYGNHEHHTKAWHYLQECITFSEHLNMDTNESYLALAPLEAQWRRRLYWLLFITERAYAVQRRRHCRLHRSIDMPSVFESEDPQLLTGFVNLANLFAAVDDNFVSAWRGTRRASLCNEDWLKKTQKALDATTQLLNSSQGAISETQHLDISVTREWLHVLAWQMGVSNGLIWQETAGSEGGMGLDYPIELARKVVELTSGANRGAIDAHGIGMEQKLSDIAGCLADVLKCTSGDSSPSYHLGKEYLNILLQQLSSIRGKESRYLKPLMSKMDGLLGYEMNGVNQQLQPPPTLNLDGLDFDDATWAQMARLPSFSMGRGLSMSGGIDMLRRLSSQGILGMQPLGPTSDGTWRRPSGRVYSEEETADMNNWAQNSASGRVPLSTGGPAM